jgi:adenylosuccinate synthase
VNASHIIEWDDGRSYKFQHLASSIINPSTDMVMGAGASIQLDQMLKEIADWNLTPERLFIHPNAVVITQADVDYEKEHLVRIASTMTGNGAAAGKKVMRHPDCKFAIDFPELKPFVRDTTTMINGWLRGGKTGILETAQGFELSMDHGGLYEDSDGTVHRAYPYTTSRNVDPLTFAGMTGVAPKMLGNVLLNLRAFPIRVGDGSNNKIDGYSGVDLTGSSSGPIWPDQKELSWEEVTKISGSTTEIREMTSLTKRLRRVFTFSTMQHQHITKVVQPDFITINFVNYVDASSFGVCGKMSRKKLSIAFPAIARLVSRVECEQYWAGTPYAGKVVWLGTGPRESQYIELTED